MKKEEFKELCDLSLLALGNKYAWKKLRTQGLVHAVENIGRGRRARRMPLTVEGVKHYLKTTLDMQAKTKEELEKQQDGRN